MLKVRLKRSVRLPLYFLAANNRAKNAVSERLRQSETRAVRTENDYVGYLGRRSSRYRRIRFVSEMELEFSCARASKSSVGYSVPDK